MAAFKIDSATGALTHLNTIANVLDGNSHISTNGKVVIGSAYGGADGATSGVNVAKIRADGGLEDSATSVSHKGGSGVHRGAELCQDGSHCHSGYVDPSGGYVLVRPREFSGQVAAPSLPYRGGCRCAMATQVSDLGQDKIYSYAIDSSTHSLCEHQVLETAPGAGPRHMVFHPSGDWVYGINELDCTVSAYPYADGILGTPSTTITTLPAGYNNHDHANAKNAEGNAASGPNRPDDQTNACADIHVTPDGKYLYGSNRGHDSIVCYKIGGGGGDLTFVSFTPTYGEHPRNFGIHPSGKWVLVANQDSGTVVVFALDPATGSLTPTGDVLEVEKPRCVKWAAAASANL
jgi:6-phosphogluconolactonase